MKMAQWIKTPKTYILIAIVVYLSIASWATRSMAGIENGGIAAGTAIVVDVLFALIKKRKRIMPDGAAITGLLVAMILSLNTAWFIIACTAALSIISKHLLVYKKKAIFNPAAIGLFLSIPIFHAEQSWWGAFGDLPGWYIPLLLIGGYAVTNRVNKYPQVFAFFLITFAMTLAMAYFHKGDAFDALRPPFINATLFFGCFMLTDPPTSPAKIRDQVVFGVIAAITGSVIYGLYGGLMYLFIGLLAGNVFHLLMQRLTANRPKSSSKPSSQQKSKPISTLQR
ncbi:NQR2/RnfD/RnfE family subunit of NADH-ubiquinone oxidoreductase [Paenibacillus taihuensis]|uniref:NQR2/RnfD/RnfE family subunit of NADH-ubiquinone oxidoreductase n=1 Tax=Paenibacillus taihuensis TaxID=1156355 RepID=A0A3D9QZZ3_9BACL|nr:RnfABCDGE type electron transport complex subunit D [Paenibacillus taihuensis]REE66740.1 NQR2/RnfD/RnfE family subunit of NADH-ubiquinone oxidoreductase [Paenibacillus taihuensis]